MNNRSTRQIAQFPACPTCGQAVIKPVSDAAIMVQVCNDAPIKIPRSQAAAYLRFTGQVSPCGVVAQQVYAALGQCINVGRVRNTLKKRLGGENVPGEEHPKVKGAGTFGVFYMPEHVRVWDVEEEGKVG